MPGLAAPLTSSQHWSPTSGREGRYKLWRWPAAASFEFCKLSGQVETRPEESRPEGGDTRGSGGGAKPALPGVLGMG